MLVKINKVNEGQNKVNVTKLDIDDYGSIIPVKDLELILPSHDESIVKILKNSSHAAVFTEGDIDDSNSIIISASGMSNEDLNREKQNVIDSVRRKRQHPN
ncbi:MAG TPA: hypothetical protein VH415_13770 [Nitrososphaeraceae archaeon]|jgi:hypothetical protein